MRYLYILIVVYLIGMLSFLTLATFGNPSTDLIYHLWSKGFDSSLFAWVVIYQFARPLEKKMIKWIIAYASIRLTWELVSYISGVSINDSKGVAALFLALIVVLIFICYVNFKQIRKFI